MTPPDGRCHFARCFNSEFRSSVLVARWLRIWARLRLARSWPCIAKGTRIVKSRSGSRVGGAALAPPFARLALQCGIWMWTRVGQGRGSVEVAASVRRLHPKIRRSFVQPNASGASEPSIRQNFGACFLRRAVSAMWLSVMQSRLRSSTRPILCVFLGAAFLFPSDGARLAGRLVKNLTRRSRAGPNHIFSQSECASPCSPR